jgi:hypothetical protein
MAHIHRLIFVLLLALSSVNASAVALQTWSGPMGWRVSAHAVTKGFTTKELACQKWVVGSSYSSTYNAASNVCTLNTGYSSGFVTSPTLACPPGGLPGADGNSCYCPSGTKVNGDGSACVADDVCQVVLGQALPERQATAKVGALSTAGITALVKAGNFSFCDGTGCQASGKAIAGGSFGGESFITVDKPVFTGVSCDKNAAPGTTPQDAPQLCAAGSCPGTVNGVESCYPCTSGVTSSNSTSSSSGTTTTPTGGTSTSTTTENKTTITVCEGNQCTSTTTTTNNSGSGSGSPTATVSEDSKTESLSDFCKANPKADLCKSTVDSKFSGACGQAPSCSGDAILCAIAAESLKAACALNPPASAESGLYESEKSKTGSVTGSLPGNDTVQITSGSFSTEAVLGTGACITDRTITVMSKTIVLPFSVVCPWLDSLRALLLGVSWLAAFAIVFKQTV